MSHSGNVQAATKGSLPTASEARPHAKAVGCGSRCGADWASADALSPRRAVDRRASQRHPNRLSQLSPRPRHRRRVSRQQRAAQRDEAALARACQVRHRIPYLGAAPASGRPRAIAVRAHLAPSAAAHPVRAHQARGDRDARAALPRCDARGDSNPRRRNRHGTVGAARRRSARGSAAALASRPRQPRRRQAPRSAFHRAQHAPRRTRARPHLQQCRRPLQCRSLLRSRRRAHRRGADFLGGTRHHRRPHRRSQSTISRNAFNTAATSLRSSSQSSRISVRRSIVRYARAPLPRHAVA